MSSSLWLHESSPTRLLCLWNFSGKNTGAGCQHPLLRDLPDPGIELASLASPALTGGFFTIVPPGKPQVHVLLALFWGASKNGNWSCTSLSQQVGCLPPTSISSGTHNFPLWGSLSLSHICKKGHWVSERFSDLLDDPSSWVWCSHVSASMCCSSGFPKGLFFWASDVPESQFLFSLPLMGDEGQRPICHVWAESLRTQLPGVSLVFSKVMHVGFLLGIGSDQRVLLYTPDLGSNHVFPPLSLSLCWKPSLPPPKELSGCSKSSFRFSMRSYRKSQMNFLASPI